MVCFAFGAFPFTPLKPPAKFVSNFTRQTFAAINANGWVRNWVISAFCSFHLANKCYRFPIYFMFFFMHSANSFPS